MTVDSYQLASAGLLVGKGSIRSKFSLPLRPIRQPLRVSSYELSKHLPEDFKGSLSTNEEIEAELRGDK